MNLDSNAGGRRPTGAKPAMNVTPLVDVVLVLLIIFMVVTPLLTKQLWLNVPPKAEEPAPPPPPDAMPPIVLHLAMSGATTVNGETIERTQLPQRVRRMIDSRPDKVVFFDADDDVPYGQALAVMDTVRSGGIETLAVLADPVAQ